MTESKEDLCVLPRVFDVRAVEEVHADFLTGWRKGVVTVDASTVEEVDTAGLQLLAAVRASGKSSGVEVAFRDPSEALIEAAAILGLGELWN